MKGIFESRRLISTKHIDKIRLDKHVQIVGIIDPLTFLDNYEDNVLLENNT
jgi:hypothetical protein